VSGTEGGTGCDLLNIQGWALPTIFRFRNDRLLFSIFHDNPSFLAFIFLFSLIYDVGSAHPTFELLFIYDVDSVRHIVVFNEV
jgi:hypothetical protein